MGPHTLYLLFTFCASVSLPPLWAEHWVPPRIKAQMWVLCPGSSLRYIELSQTDIREHLGLRGEGDTCALSRCQGSKARPLPQLLLVLFLIGLVPPLLYHCGDHYPLRLSGSHRTLQGCPEQGIKKRQCWCGNSHLGDCNPGAGS